MESIIRPNGNAYANVGVVEQKLHIKLAESGITVVMDKRVVPQLTEILINIMKETNVRDLV
jgi:hypothetical protein